MDDKFKDFLKERRKIIEDWIPNFDGDEWESQFNPGVNLTEIWDKMDKKYRPFLNEQNRKRLEKENKIINHV